MVCPRPETLQWTPLHFAGGWGISTSFFQLAALEARANPSKDRSPVPQRAQEIASQIAGRIDASAGFARVEAVKGYLNLYYSNIEFSCRVIDTVLSEADDFGRGAPKSERVMVEYANMNTHHSFHIGHFRNTILGEALARLVEFGGFPTIRASYPGDIGLGVITILWIYQKFYQGQEPQGFTSAASGCSSFMSKPPACSSRKRMRPPKNRRCGKHTKPNAASSTANGTQATRRHASFGCARASGAWMNLTTSFRWLDIKIDVWFFESDVDESAKLIVDELIRLGIADDERPDGPVIVKIDEKLGLKKEKYRTNVILRRDGTTLYLTKDLALAKEEVREISRRPVDLCGRCAPEPAFAADFQNPGAVGLQTGREMLPPGLWLRQPAGRRHVCPARAGGAVQGCGG